MGQEVASKRAEGERELGARWWARGGKQEGRRGKRTRGQMGARGGNQEGRRGKITRGQMGA